VANQFGESAGLKTTVKEYAVKMPKMSLFALQKKFDL
jgi:hypothetical protein